MFYRKRDVVEGALREQHSYGPLHYMYDHDVRPRLYQRPIRTRLIEDLRRDFGLPERGYSAEEDARARAMFAALSRGRHLIYRVYWFTSEVSNGGVVQYLWNSSGDEAEELIQDLKELELPRLTAALRAACDEIFAGPVPKDLRARRQAMEGFFQTHPFSDDDDCDRLAGMRPSSRAEEATAAFHQEELGLVHSVREWIARNKNEFAT